MKPGLGWSFSRLLAPAACALILVGGNVGKGQSVAVPDSIRAEGVPPIPLDVSQALNRYQNIRAASFQGWDPQGKGMYITTRFADTPQVHAVAGPGRDRTQLTFLVERVLGVSPRPKHNQFLYEVDEGGAENYQLWLQDRAGGEARRITDGKSRNTSPVWSDSGELLAWSSNARNGTDMDLYVAAPADPNFVRRFKDVAGEWTVSDWSPDETKVAVVEYVSINESYIHLVEIATGRVETITPRPTDPKAEPVAASDPRWAPDGSALFYLTDEGNEFRRLVYRDLRTGQVQVLTGNIPWDVEEFDVSDDGSLIALVANEQGAGKLHVLSLTLSQAPLGVIDLVVPSLPPGQITGVEFKPHSHSIGCTINSANASSDAFEIAASPRGNAPALVRWTESEMGGLDASAFVQPELISFVSFDGRQIPAFVYRPPAAAFSGPRPVLVNIHGGPEAQFRPMFLGRLNYLINELGLTLIFPNVRGSAGYGKSYLRLDNGMLREGPVKDIGALLDWIKTQPNLDATKVGVTGGSYGGFMSLAVQTNYNDRIKAGIDIVGISNFVTFLKNTQDYRRDLRRAEYGDEREEAMRTFLERVSPLSSIERIKTPILVVQEQNDPRVPLSEAEQVVAAVSKNHVPVWYVVGKNEGHGFAKRVNQDYLQAVEVAFLRKFLLGQN
jgi:dipeptidyl aminopeptidase/acylaminoacyl peptidase